MLGHPVDVVSGGLAVPSPRLSPTGAGRGTAEVLAEVLADVLQV